MALKLDDFMDWPEIEALTYADCMDPGAVLGCHVADKTHALVTAYLPSAKSVKVKVSSASRTYSMKKMDDNGYFAALIPGQRYTAGKRNLRGYALLDYRLVVSYSAKEQKEIIDPYSIDPKIDEIDITQFLNGIHKNPASVFGARVIDIDGIKGTVFTLWAPNARAVSVVGDFCDWDEMRYPMRRLSGVVSDDYGIFELFIPGVTKGALYKYRIIGADGIIRYKADPYATQTGLRPETASRVYGGDEYEWGDKKWMKDRMKPSDIHSAPVSIYECSLQGFIDDKATDAEGENTYYSYRDIADELVPYCKSMGYTHIQLMPINAYPYDASLGYQTIGYYAVSSRFGTPEDFKYFIDSFHKADIGVIVDWVPGDFPADEQGLSEFDGTHLYEHLDPRLGIHPYLGTRLFNYNRHEVSNFLLGSAMYLVDEYHIDGLRISSLGTMLYLDYGRDDYVPNLYGGNENLDGIGFLRTFNDMAHERGVITIAQAPVVYPGLTEAVEDDGIGFDFLWNDGWKHDFLDYMKTDPLFRRDRHGMLTLSMVYQYTANYILAIGHDDLSDDKGSMYVQMAGMDHQKIAGIRLSLGYQIAHPGKVLNFAGTETACEKSWSLGRKLYPDLDKTGGDMGILPSSDDTLDDRDDHDLLKDYVKDLNKFYKSHPALYKEDENESGFEWISELNADMSMIAFMRKCESEELLIVCNFTPVPYAKLKLGVPYPGKYKEIFCSDAECYGGFGFGNPRLKHSKKYKWDGRANSIDIKLAPMAIHIFTCERI